MMAAVLDLASTVPPIAGRLATLSKSEYEFKVARIARYYSAFKPDVILREYAEEHLRELPESLVALRDGHLAKFQSKDPRVKAGPTSGALKPGIWALDLALKPIVKRDRPLGERLWVDLKFADRSDLTEH